jgi:flagellar biosynthesis anti-sigma factor FlgM
MRIDVSLPASVSVGSDSPKAKIGSNRPSGATISGDSASLSADSVATNSLRAELAKMPDVRQDTVASLRRSIQNGTYKSDSSRTAVAILSELFGGNATVN